MLTEDQIRNIVHNKCVAEEEIEKGPQTYKTLLKQCYCNKTWQAIIRRKLNNSWKEGVVLKAVIPGTRFGTVVFTSKNKQYNIIVESSRIGVNIYYFFKHKWKNEFVLQLKEYWKLEKDKWVKYDDEKVISKGSILKWI